MKRNTISVRRRQLMIAGLAGVATPASLYAGQHDALVANLSAAADGSKGALVVSGRILSTDGEPLYNALVEMWHAATPGELGRATTDGDGRFFATIAGRAHRPSRLHYRVSHPQGTQERQLDLARERGLSRDVVSHLQRDDTGVWRASFGAALA